MPASHPGRRPPAAVLLILLVLAAGCGGRMLDTEDVERVTAQRLAETVGHEPRSIDCPDDMEARTGNTERCTLTAPDGSTIGVTIEVLDEDGRFEARVDDTGGSR